MSNERYLAKAIDLESLAEAIRLKASTTESLSFPNGYAQLIEDIPQETLDETKVINKRLTEYANSVIISIRSCAFYYCSSLKTVSFPSCTTIGISAFQNCNSLQTVFFPNCTTIRNSAFYYCNTLQTVSFPKCTSIGTDAFAYCKSLQSVYILASSVPVLKATAFGSTPISKSSYIGHFGSIFVPLSLVDTYKTASAWSKYADRIVGI